MTYLQAVNVTNLPYAIMNEYDIRYNYVKCNTTVDIRNYNYDKLMRVGDIFEIHDVSYECHDWTNLIHMPYNNMDSHYYDDYDIVMMKQNNTHIFAKMAHDADKEDTVGDNDNIIDDNNMVNIVTPDYCSLSDTQFNKTITTKLFHYPKKMHATICVKILCAVQ